MEFTLRTGAKRKKREREKTKTKLGLKLEGKVNILGPVTPGSLSWLLDNSSRPKVAHSARIKQI